MTGKFTKGSDGRTRFRGQGKRGAPSIVRAAIGSLGLAIKSLKEARDHLTRVELENPDRMQRDALIAAARDQVRIGVGLASEAMSGGLPKGRAGKIAKVSGKQLGLALAAAKQMPAPVAATPGEHPVNSDSRSRKSCGAGQS